MVTIYEVANLVLNDIMNIYCKGNNDFSEVIKYLNGNSNRFDKVFDSYGETVKNNKNTIRRVIMLNIFSYAYLVNLYKIKIDLDSDACEKYLSILESLDPSEIFDMFACFSPEVKIFYEDASEYLTNTYIFKYCCWQTLFVERKKATLFKINPFSIMEQNDLDLGDGFIETEANIQTFDNLYEKALEKASLDPELNEDDDPDKFDALVIEHLIELINEYFGNNEKQKEAFFATIFSNIYENITLNIKINKKQRKKYESLLTKFEEYTISDFINMFESNYSFAIDIIDIFITYNSYLEKGELISRRIEFLTKGNSQKLAELNPFYEQDNAVLKRQKEKGSL